MPLSYDGPPELTPGRLVTAWQFDPWAVLALVVVAAAYLVAVRRLRVRGVVWPVSRTVFFVGFGLGTVAVALLSSIGTYDDTLFWVHMLQHMLLAMVAPVFLALGAPVTLALRTLPRRPRRLLVRLLHSRVAQVVSSPLVAAPLFAATPFALYLTGIYQASLHNNVLHELLHLHFLVVGCLFLWPLVGVDPVPGRMPHLLRLLLLFVTLPLHAWLGITIMSARFVIAGDYYRELARPWGPSLLADQGAGGGLIWASGDFVGLVMLAALFLQWMRADERAAVREDRRLDRLDHLDRRGPAPPPGPALPARTESAPADSEAELAAYNERLAALARRPTD